MVLACSNSSSHQDFSFVAVQVDTPVASSHSVYLNNIRAACSQLSEKKCIASAYYVICMAIASGSPCVVYSVDEISLFHVGTSPTTH